LQDLAEEFHAAAELGGKGAGAGAGSGAGAGGVGGGQAATRAEAEAAACAKAYDRYVVALTSLFDNCKAHVPGGHAQLELQIE
jgi:hypothetical protein